MEIEQRKRERSPSSTSEGGKSPRRGKTETERWEGGETDGGGKLSEFVKQLLITAGPEKEPEQPEDCFQLSCVLAAHHQPASVFKVIVEK